MVAPGRGVGYGAAFCCESHLQCVTFAWVRGGAGLVGVFLSILIRLLGAAPSLHNCLALSLRASLIAYKPIAYKSHLPALED